MGVTLTCVLLQLVMQIAVDVMVVKCGMLESYMKTALAPLGMLFPFPHHFPKLDSCMMTTAQLWDRFRCDGSLKAGVPSNSLFWQQEVVVFVMVLGLCIYV